MVVVQVAQVVHIMVAVEAELALLVLDPMVAQVQNGLQDQDPIMLVGVLPVWESVAAVLEQVEQVAVVMVWAHLVWPVAEPLIEVAAVPEHLQQLVLEPVQLVLVTVAQVL
jgi:hypothetical protein